jgi:GT2 family glycosyltransferase/glycosyltransferase involved in cell wall biosynthesis
LGIAQRLVLAKEAPTAPPSSAMTARVTPRATVVILVQRNAPQAIAAVKSLHRASERGLAFETILLLNGADEATATQIRRGCRGIRIEKSVANLGFGGGCNWVASQSQAEYLVFLNDDVLVDAGWLDALVDAADSDPEIGAVGSRVRYPDGTLQEAGSIIWRDGYTMPVGRGLPASGPAWRFRRDVDYCSASALLVRRSEFEAVGGFDEAYYPAYYEDVDLCLAIAQRGKRIVFEPRAELVHFESQSSTGFFKAFLFRRNHRRLTQKWRSVLETRFGQGDLNDPVAVKRAIARAQGASINVLVIDDQLPDPGLGSGYGRTLELVHDLADRRFAVKFYASNCPVPDVAGVGALGVEVVTRSLRDELVECAFDIAIISRPHNYDLCAPLIREMLPDCRICYDVESLFFRRIEKQAHVETDIAERTRLRALAADGKESEFAIIRAVDRVVCISHEERRIVESIEGHPPVDFMLPIARTIEPTLGDFSSREPLAIFVAGWMAGAVSPNADGIRWFCREVLPIIRRQAPLFRVIVTGGSPPPNVTELASASVAFVGYVADLAPLYARARVAISPLRFGAGVKIKTIEAIQHGLPVVATSVGAEGFRVDNPDAIVVEDDPDRFADAIAEIVLRESSWTVRREAALAEARGWLTMPTTRWSDVCESMVQASTPERRAELREG